MKTFGALLFALFLIACDGGSDTSSGAGSSTVTQSAAAGGETGGDDIGGDPSSASRDDATSAGPPATSITYKGMADVTLSAPGFPDTDKSTPVTVVITGSSVDLTVEGRTVSTGLNRNTFSVDTAINESKNGISCSGSIAVNASVNASIISGLVTGSGKCNVAEQDIPVTIVGTINARS